MEQKLFEADFTEILYTIEIKVGKNCASLGIIPRIQKEVKYHEAIGVLETQKMNLIMTQREKTLKKN